MTLLLDLCAALFLGEINTFHPLLIDTGRLQVLLLALVADLPGLLLAVLGVAVLLGFLRASLHFKLADLLRLKVAILLLNWKGEDVGELLAVPVDISFAQQIKSETYNLPFWGYCSNPVWEFVCIQSSSAHTRRSWWSLPSCS